MPAVVYPGGMPDLPLSSKYRTNPQGAVDDDERAELTERLSAEYTAGRIDQDDYLAKLDVIYNAQTLGDLVPVVSALPPRSTHGVPDIVLKGKGTVPGTVNRSKNLTPLVAGATAGLVFVAGIVLILLFLLIF